jgi:Zn-dependent protease
MFGRAYRIASVRGVGIEMSPAWLLIVALLAWTLADDIFPAQYKSWSTATAWAVGLGAALTLPFSVALHELSHASAAIRRGITVPKVTLMVFGGATHLSRQPKSPGEEFAIASAGAVTSVGIAFAASLIAFAARGRLEVVEGLFVFLFLENAAIALFNCIPGFPLDGGRVLRSVAWRRTRSFRRATRIAAGAGESTGYVLLASGVVLLLSGFFAPGLWIGLIGWFLVGAAKAETQTLQLESILSRMKARDVMRDEWPTVVPGASLQEIVDDHMLGAGERMVVVANDGVVLGLLTVSDIRKTNRLEWAKTPAQQVMRPREKIITVQADAPAVETMMILARLQLNQVPVLEGGRMVGLVSRQELLDRVKLVETLAPDLPQTEEE